MGGDGVQVTVIGISDRNEQNLTLHMCPYPACFISYILVEQVYKINLHKHILWEKWSGTSQFRPTTKYPKRNTTEVNQVLLRDKWF